VEGQPIPASANAISTILQSHSSLSTAPSQQTRHARRIYVGNLSETSEEEIGAFFLDLIKKACINPPKGNPILSVYLNKERKFSFIEFSTIELANAIMELDGLLFHGAPVKIKHANDYAPQNLPIEIRDKKEPMRLEVIPMERATGVVGTGSSAANRIFIGGIPNAINEPELRELLEAFGPLRSMNIVRGLDGTHKGYGFCEYMDVANAPIAVSGLNGLQIGDKTLNVSIAKQADKAASLPVASAAPMTGSSTTSAALAPSRLILLENMVTQEELQDDNEYRDILEDITNECSKYGQLLEIQIIRPPHPAGGRVFLLYEDVDGANSASRALSGRQFGGKVIIVKSYSEELYRNYNYTE
jgi:splicing factor U2AF 65 kDa subunit